MSTTPTPNGAGQARGPASTVRDATPRPAGAKPGGAGGAKASARAAAAESAPAVSSRSAAAKATVVRTTGAKAPTPKPPAAKVRAAKPAAPGGTAAKPGPGRTMLDKAMPGKGMAGKPIAPKPIAPKPTAPKPRPGGGPAVTLPDRPQPGRPAGKPVPGKPPAGEAREAGRLGKLAPQFPTAVKFLPRYLAEPLPPAPASVDYAKPVTEGFPMDGNDRYGDCTIAAAAHLIQAWNAETGVRMPVPAETDVVAQYLELSGGEDTGLVESEVLRGWLSSGLWGNKIVAYAPVNVHALDSIKQAVAYFGGVYVGVQVPENAPVQFEGHRPWILEQGWQDHAIVGGHAIPVLGYDDEYMYCVTWGAVHPVSWDWWSVYGDEAWVVLSEEFDRAGKFNGIDIATLRADIAGR